LKDYMIRAISLDGSIRVVAARTTDIVSIAREVHNLSNTATAALGRLLTAGLLVSTGMKGDDTLTLRVNGGGPLGNLIVDADADGHIRGYVSHPEVELPLKNGKLDVGGAVGSEGQMYLTKDLGLKEPYTGSARLISGEIAEDMTYFLWQSEQIRSATTLGVLVGKEGVLAAGGLLLQLLPGYDEGLVDNIEANFADLSDISRIIETGVGPEELVARALAGIDYRIIDEKEVSFTCRCSKDKVAAALILLEDEELLEMMGDERTVAKCHFCGEEYVFTREDLREFIKNKKAL